MGAAESMSVMSVPQRDAASFLITQCGLNSPPEAEMRVMDTLPLLALVASVVGATETTEIDSQKEAQLKSYILGVNPRFPYPNDPARLLLKIEAAGGPPATLFAVLITVESQWGRILRKHPWNLSQLTQWNQRRMYGRRIRGWVESVKWGAEYFTGNLAAAKRKGRPLREVWFVALACYNDGPRGPSTRKGQVYARAVLRRYDKAFG